MKVHPKTRNTLTSRESKAYQLRMKRKESTATDMLHEMYMIHAKRLPELYGEGKTTGISAKLAAPKVCFFLKGFLSSSFESVFYNLRDEFSGFNRGHCRRNRG